MKGAAALCNGLARHLPVTMVSLQPSHGEGLVIDRGVSLLRLDGYRAWTQRLREYRHAVEAVRRKRPVASISFGLKSDLMSLLAGRGTRTISSVRGNLVRNYRYDYGWLGLPAVLVHYLLLRRFDAVVAMSDAMAAQLGRFGIKRLVTVGNFVDELALAEVGSTQPRNEGPVRFVFLASLTSRKRPELLIDAVREVQSAGLACHLDMVGNGPWRAQLENRIREQSLSSSITIHGYVANPYHLLTQSDIMILPSESEGVSRSVLEALFLGIPCVLRNVDGNSEVVTPGHNGELFTNDNDLPDAMCRAAQRMLSGDYPASGLVPPAFRQLPNINRYIELVSQTE